MEISILWLKSISTGKEFPVIQLSDDTDMVTGGFDALTSIEKNEVVLAEVRGSETNVEFEKRINAQLKRNDLRASWIIRQEDKNQDLKGMSFQEFRKRFQPPILYYRDIYSEGEAVVSRAVALDEYLRTGGQMLRANNDA
jgi:hypothetical protein